MQRKQPTDQEVVDKALELARIIYKSNGYNVPKGFKFYDSHHPQEIGMWNIAVMAFDFIDGTDVESALDNVAEE